MASDPTCMIEECDTVVYARGWCHRHYTRWRIHGDPAADYRRVRKPCNIADCEQLATARGWCPKHYERWKKHGDPLYTRPVTCCIEDCERPRKSKQGWCSMHWKRWKRNGDAEYQRPVICIIPDCENPVSGRGWCKMHYHRWERNGDPTLTMVDTRPAVERFRSKVQPGAGNVCWPWDGPTQRNGYGTLRVEGKYRRAHRYAYELAYGPVPDGYTIDHTCHDPEQCEGGVDCPHRRCCNPAHLKAVPPGHNNTKGRCVSRKARRRTASGGTLSPQATQRSLQLAAGRAADASQCLRTRGT
ncbi:HNH endonuclease signature motif containing protein [Streptomyces chartreusis]|uniref:HNH endonuclease signature motif containing protein n=1 Tax=Streptomyces chartreusis TaxID=1969 RepID=UPI00364E5FBA